MEELRVVWRLLGAATHDHKETLSYRGAVGNSTRVGLYELTRRRTRWHESGIQETDQSTLYCQSFLDGVFYNCSGRRGVFFALVLLYYRLCLCCVDYMTVVAHSFCGITHGLARN